MLFFFFFQAEDGIRDLIVTGVQTCALPISSCEPTRCLRHPRSLPGSETGVEGHRGSPAARIAGTRRHALAPEERHPRRAQRILPKLFAGWRDSPVWRCLTSGYMGDLSAAMARRTEAQGAPSSKVIAGPLISTPSLRHSSPRSVPAGAAFISL